MKGKNSRCELDDCWYHADGWIQLWMGGQFFPLTGEGPIRIEDIAHGLSCDARYTGQGRYLSVAEHSVRVSRIAAELAADAGATADECAVVARYGLLHDASEAYLRDVPKPLKFTPIFDQYRAVEEKIQRRVYERFGLAYPEPDVVVRADKMVVGNERRRLFPRGTFGDASHVPAGADPVRHYEAKWGLAPQDAEVVFLAAFSRLWPDEPWEAT